MEVRVVGRLHLAAAAIFFVYYSLWVIGTPFVDPAYRRLWSRAFPPPSHALLAPAVLSTAVFLTLLGRAYYLVSENRRKVKSE